MLMSRLLALLLAAVPAAHALQASGAFVRLGASAPMHSRLCVPVAMADEEKVTMSFGDADDVGAEAVSVVVEEREMTDKEKEIARLRAAEKFMKKDTGDAVCQTCGYTYKMETGDGFYPKNTPFDLLPSKYVCPNCKSPKAFFDPVQIEIAGFADNQAYGLGTNTWTEGQKSNAIFGGLALFFALFIGGYGLN